MYFWRKFDLVGIVLQIMGSCTSPFYYSFYCDEDKHLFWRYAGLTWVVCLIAGACVLMPMGLRGKAKHYLCALAFLLAGWSTSPGCIHMMFYRNDRTMFDCSFMCWLGGGCLYSIGAIIYAVKFPERCGKGCFDVIGSSHQIFHVSILTAALVHFYASINEYHMRQITHCPLSPHSI